MTLLVPGDDPIHNSVINSDKFSWDPVATLGWSGGVKHWYQSSPLSPGTHALTVPHGLARIEQPYHVAGSGPVCVAHSGGPGIGWEYLRMPELEEHLTMVYVEPAGTGRSGHLPDARDHTVATAL